MEVSDFDCGSLDLSPLDKSNEPRELPFELPFNRGLGNVRAMLGVAGKVGSDGDSMLDKYALTLASPKSNMLSSFFGVAPSEELQRSDLLGVRVEVREDADEVEERDEVEEWLRASVDDFLFFRRWANRALLTSNKRKPSLVAIWNA